MSPTEFDLRAALRDGEGDEPDVDHLVAGAQAARSLRRTRILSTAAAVVVVAGAAVGGAFLVSHNGGNNANHPAAAAAAAGGAGSAPAAAPQAAADPQAAAASRSSAADSSTNSSVAPNCPLAYPQSLLPGGGSPGQFGASGRLFAKPVASIVVCSYTDVASTTATTSAPGRTLLTGSSAQTLASSLENAQKTPLNTACPDYIVADAPSLAIIAVSTDGTTLPTVTTTLGRPACHTQVSNGTVVRYGWSLPSSLGTTLSPHASGATGTSSSPSH